MTWRETVKGEYWIAGPFRIEKIRDFVAMKFTKRHDVVKIGWYPTLETAKHACELEDHPDRPLTEAEQQEMARDPHPLDPFPPTGISVRDYFAGQAMAAYDWSSLDWNEWQGLTPEKERGHWAGIAKHCYGYAAAMLAERDRLRE